MVLAAFTFHSPSYLRADGAEETVESSQASETIDETPETSSPEASAPQDAGSESEDEEEPKGTPVAPADNSAQKSRNRQFWTNILIAGVAVVVAVVSILVVSNNNGKKH